MKEIRRWALLVLTAWTLVGVVIAMLDTAGLLGGNDPIDVWLWSLAGLVFVSTHDLALSRRRGW